jgi:hypothetical protein
LRPLRCFILLLVLCSHGNDARCAFSRDGDCRTLLTSCQPHSEPLAARSERAVEAAVDNKAVCVFLVAASQNTNSTCLAAVCSHFASLRPGDTITAQCTYTRRAGLSCRRKRRRNLHSPPLSRLLSLRLSVFSSFFCDGLAGYVLHRARGIGKTSWSHQLWCV